MLTLDNKRVHDYIVQKDLLVDEGRKISREIEAMEVKIRQFEDQERKLTAKITPPKELTDRGEVVTKELMKLTEELNSLSQKINDFKLEAVPKDIKDAHIKLLKDKEPLERARNKVALKVQKLKDKLVPIVQKELKPLLGEYEDLETAKAKDGKVIISTFNYLEDWKAKFNRR